MAKITQQPPRVWRLTRAGAIEPNPTTLIQRASSFAASAPDGTVLLTRRDGDGLSHYVIAPNSVSVEQATLHLAQTVAARVDEVESAEQLFAARHVAIARYDVGSVVGRDVQVGADLSEISGRLASSLRSGEWVAAVIRHPNKREVRRYQKWLQHQVGGGAKPNHHSMQQSAVVMSLWSGAETAGEAKALLRQVAAAMPGFDVQISPHAVTRTLRGALITLAGIAAAASGIMLLLSRIIIALDTVEYTVGAISGLGAATAVAGILYLAGRIPSYSEKVRRLARINTLMEPRARLLPPSRPRREHVGRDGETQLGTDGSYPLDSGAFMVGPQLPVGLIAPHAGAASGSATTQERVAPSTMRSRVGPYIGDNDGQPVYLSAEDLFGGVAAFGFAGSGKSRMIQALFAWAGLERSRPSGEPGFPGAQNTLVAFESKGEGADAYQEWAKTVGDPVLRIDFAGVGDIQLDILNIPGNAEKRARAVVNALKYAFSDGSIQERSFDTLTQVFTAAFAVTPEVAVAAELNPERSPFYFASILLGGRGDAAGVALAGAIKSEVARLNLSTDTDLGNAADMLAAIYEGKTPAQRAQLTDAPRNKVSALLAAESWWARPKKLTWDQILNNHWPVVINTGITRTGDQADDQLVEQVSAMMMYTLYEAIKRNCSGWFEQGRAVTIFADELKLLAGSSATVLTWLRDQGRSYGVRAIFATQYPEQLVPEVRASVMGFGTLLAFAQNNPEVIRTLIADLNLAGEEWTNADVANLPAFHTIVRTTVKRARQAPFTVGVRDFWSHRDTFSADQGYDS